MDIIHIVTIVWHDYGWKLDVYKIKCECGTGFCVGITAHEDEIECPDCYRRYDTLQTMTIKPHKDNDMVLAAIQGNKLQRAFKSIGR